MTADQTFRKRVVRAAAMVAAVTVSGCGMPRGAVRSHSGPYPVAVWYYVRGYVPQDPEQARSIMASDFAHIRSLGFNTIVADAVDDDRRDSLLDTAMDQSLQVVLPHAKTRAYIKQGDSNTTTRAELRISIRENVEAVGGHAALRMHYVYDAPTAGSADRLAEVVKLYRSLDPSHEVLALLSRDPTSLVERADLPVVLWDNFPLSADAAPGELKNRRYSGPTTHSEALAEIYAKTPGRRHWAMIQAFSLPGKLRAPTPAEWDLIYMSSLATGFVDGVAFYRYHADKESDTGLSPANHAMQPRRIRAVRRITKRARKWGPMLARAKPSFEAVRQTSGQVKTALLCGPKRRFLLIYNPNVETFSHDTVYVPATIQGRRVVRAVDVGEPKRYMPEGSDVEIPIKIDLRPGDGRLMELFGP